MAEHFIKAYCEKSGQYYGMRVEEINGTMQITDFYDMDADAAKKVSSTVSVSDLRSAYNLRACSGCGGRKAGGCNCAKRGAVCKSGRGYRFQCLYCSDLQIFGAKKGKGTGETIIVGQKQVVELCGDGEAALEHIRVGVGWDIARAGERSMDIDSSVFVRNGRTSDSELVYFGNKVHPSGCVVHMGDNLVGGKYSSETNDSENIDVYLKKVPADRDSIYFVLNIYSCEDRRQNFGCVHNMYIRLTDMSSGTELMRYTVENTDRTHTGMVIAKVYREDGMWNFQSIGKSVRVPNVRTLERYCE